MRLEKARVGRYVGVWLAYVGNMTMNRIPISVTPAALPVGVAAGDRVLLPRGALCLTHILFMGRLNVATRFSRPAFHPRLKSVYLVRTGQSKAGAWAHMTCC